MSVCGASPAQERIGLATVKIKRTGSPLYPGCRFFFDEEKIFAWEAKKYAGCLFLTRRVQTFFVSAAGNSWTDGVLKKEMT